MRALIRFLLGRAWKRPQTTGWGWKTPQKGLKKAKFQRFETENGPVWAWVEQFPGSQHSNHYHLTMIPPQEKHDVP